ncbi:erythromycin esterase family protein [Myroides marinus]|uniref:erythromycin esterase family protein n=1 Tax=Myroides marinus TaxID=703342 RepID=UPI002578525D|nr:erythromycin esterase family protein [Myroides marinus]MDM1380733.1 erythromycin esterase family protein [Myroides marinus]MDM1388010.1 erythromycin esterase family protein [Myroides marinus]MDM1395222.1 erythromycin esterase family protein [Myroides marinus]
MRLRFIYFFACAISLASCKVNVTENIAKQMVKVNVDSMNFIDEFIDDKDIVILGEASHGDGHTFEIKSDLVKYLVEQKGFNALAFESRDFLEIEYIRGNSFLQGRLDQNLKKDWVRQWSPWGPAQEIQVLVDVLNTEKIDPIGLETYSFSSELIALELIKQKLEEDNQVGGSVDWELLNNLHVKIFKQVYDQYTAENLQLYVSILKKLFDRVLSCEKHDMFTVQLIENAITSAELKYYSSLEANCLNLNKIITLRDLQMSKNLAWYKEQHPKAKIIVWIANFHAAKKLSAVTFTGEDDYSYNDQRVFAELVTEKYKDHVFSLAFTSSEGESRMPYEFEGVELINIRSPKNSLEKELALRDISYGFIDFKALKNKRKYNKERFHSLMLGYHNQQGDWLNVFDGLFYIRSNYIAKPIK